MTNQLAAREELKSAPGLLEVAIGYISQTEPRSAEQSRTRQQILGFCDEHSDALWRHNETGHLTGSALVVNHDLDKVLLIHHRKLDRWLQPGGHADGEANLALVALMEATEETGIEGLTVVPRIVDLDVHTIPARGEVPEHDHLDCRFVVMAPPYAVVDADESETKGAKWVGADSDLLVDADLKRLVHSGLAWARRIAN